MNELGFDGYALNYVDCPDGLLWFLKKDVNLHRTVCPTAVRFMPV
jgi:structural maintenance of chromosomes protein 5